jgi:hypothetical protein
LRFVTVRRPKAVRSPGFAGLAHGHGGIYPARDTGDGVQGALRASSAAKRFSIAFDISSRPLCLGFLQNLQPALYRVILDDSRVLFEHNSK